MPFFFQLFVSCFQILVLWYFGMMHLEFVHSVDVHLVVSYYIGHQLINTMILWTHPWPFESTVSILGKYFKCDLLLTVCMPLGPGIKKTSVWCSKLKSFESPQNKQFIPVDSRGWIDCMCRWYQKNLFPLDLYLGTKNIFQHELITMIHKLLTTIHHIRPGITG